MITPTELKAFLDNIHVIRSGTSAVIGDKTDKNSIIVLARKNSVYNFKTATPSQKRKLLNRISEGKMPEEMEGIGTNITDFVHDRSQILTKLDKSTPAIVQKILANLTEGKIDENEIKEQAVILLKRKGMPSDWQSDIGLKKRVNRVIALVRQGFAAKKTEKEKKKFGEWKKAIDVEKYWENLKNVLGEVPEEVLVNGIDFEFANFVDHMWSFIQQIIDSEKFKREIIQCYNQKNADADKNYQDIIQRLKSLRSQIFSNQTFNILGDDVSPEIRKHWNYILSEYVGCRWFSDITEKHAEIFEDTLHEKITSQNKSEIEKYTKHFRKNLPFKSKKKVPLRIFMKYLYIKILEATKYWENEVDVYIESKEETCNNGVKYFINNIDMKNLEKDRVKKGEKDICVVLKEMMDILLVGNLYSDFANPTKEKKREKYPVDDSAETLDHFFKLREQTRRGKDTELHVLHDNVGLELVSIFHLIDFCIKNEIVKKVVLHTKNYPYAISDVVGEKDIRMQINALQNASELSDIAFEKTGNIKYMEQLSDDITGHLKNQNIVIAKPHWFPTLGQNFLDIPEDYYNELKKADLILAMGDGWYSKLFLTRNWKYTADAKEILSYMPAPTVIFRIGKNPIIAGLTAKMAEYLKKIGKWWKPPRFGMIHFARGGKYARKKAYNEYETHEEAIDEQLEIAYAEGRFKAVSDEIVAPVAEFFKTSGYEKISKKLTKDPNTATRQIAINEVTGIEDFRGHASWRGIHISAELDDEEKQKVLVHEVGAYYRLTHGLNLDLEALYLDYLKKKEIDKKTAREKFKKLKEMKELPEGFSPERDYSGEPLRVIEGNAKKATFFHIIGRKIKRIVFRVIGRKEKTCSLYVIEGKAKMERDPGYFPSENSGMTSVELSRNSRMTKERTSQNSGQRAVIPVEEPGSIFRNYKKLFKLLSIFTFILGLIIVPAIKLTHFMTPSKNAPPFEYRIKESVKPVTDFLVKGLSAHGPTDIIKIEPQGTFSIEHGVEITAYNALYDVPSNAFVSDYYLMFVFKEGVSPGTRLQIFLKNREWKNLYAYPGSPTGGKVIFRPGIDPCNVCQFKPEETPYGDISAIGVKVWDGSSGNALSNLKKVYVVKNGIKPEDVLREKKTPLSQEKKESQKTPVPQFVKTPQEKLPAPPVAIPQEKSKKQKSSDPDAIVVPLDIPGTWYGQKWPDSQAISNVRYDPKRKALVGDFNIIQGHPNLDRGEVIVDVLDLGISPFNFDKWELTADVKVDVKEGSFGHTPNNADGVGFFVKTGPAQGWKNAYEWENHPENEVGDWKTISFSRGEFNKIDRVDPQDGFPLKDPIIRMFGIKLGAGKDHTGSKFTKAKGKILVRNVRITPRREKYAPPDFWPKAPSARKKVSGEIKIPITTNWPVREDAGNWAVKATHVKGGILALTVKLRGGDPEGNHNKGETYLPLYDKRGKRVVPVPGLPEEGYFDARGKVIKSMVWVPKSYAEGKKIPSAIQTGAHDKHYNYQNNAWNPSLITKNLTGKWHELKFYPMDPAENEPGYTDDDFLVVAFGELLFKTGLPGATSPDYKWDGHIYFTDIRIETDDRVFPEPVPPLIKTKMYAENPKDKPPVPIELFEMLSGAGGYGIFDFDHIPEGRAALEEKIKKMPPNARVWRHMALFGSLSPNGPILFDENDNFIDFGFIDPVTGKTVIIGVEGMKKCVDERLSILKQYGKVEITSLVAHDAADGKKKKENRIEGDRPNLFTDSKKFKRFLQGIKPILEHIRDKWRAPVPDSAGLDLIQHNFNNPKTVVAMLELFNEPLNMDTAQVPVPCIQRRIHELFELVYEIDPTWLLSTGMRDYESWKYFAHFVLPEYYDGIKNVKNPFYKNVVPQSHWYGDKESVTPLATNVGKFFMPEHVLFWLKGELDPRTPEEYKAAIGIVEVMRQVYVSAYGGGLFWVDDEFLPNWKDYQKFFKDNTAQVPFTPPTPAKPVQVVITQEVLKTLPNTIKAIKEGSLTYRDVTIFAQSEYPITFKMLTEKDVNIKLTRIGLRTDIIEALTGLAESVILRGYPLNYETISRAFKEIITLHAAKELMPHAKMLQENGIAVTHKNLSRVLKKTSPSLIPKCAEKAPPSVIPEFAEGEYPGSCTHKKLIMSLAAMLTMAPVVASANWGNIVMESGIFTTVMNFCFFAVPILVFSAVMVGICLTAQKVLIDPLANVLDPGSSPASSAGFGRDDKKEEGSDWNNTSGHFTKKVKIAGRALPGVVVVLLLIAVGVIYWMQKTTPPEFVPEKPVYEDVIDTKEEKLEIEEPRQKKFSKKLKANSPRDGPEDAEKREREDTLEKERAEFDKIFGMSKVITHADGSYKIAYYPPGAVVSSEIYFYSADKTLNKISYFDPNTGIPSCDAYLDPNGTEISRDYFDPNIQDLTKTVYLSPDGKETFIVRNRYSSHLSQMDPNGGTTEYYFGRKSSFFPSSFDIYDTSGDRATLLMLDTNSWSLKERTDRGTTEDGISYETITDLQTNTTAYREYWSGTLIQMYWESRDSEGNVGGRIFYDKKGMSVETRDAKDRVTLLKKEDRITETKYYPGKHVNQMESAHTEYLVPRNGICSEAIWMNRDGSKDAQQFDYEDKTSMWREFNKDDSYEETYFDEEGKQSEVIYYDSNNNVIQPAEEDEEGIEMGRDVSHLKRNVTHLTTLSLIAFAARELILPAVSEAYGGGFITRAVMTGFENPVISVLILMALIGLEFFVYKLRVKALSKRAGDFYARSRARTEWLIAAVLTIFVFGTVFLVKNIKHKEPAQNVQKTEDIQIKKSEEEISVDVNAIIRRVKKRRYGTYGRPEPSSLKNIQLPEAMREFEGLRFLYESSDGKTEFYESPYEKFEKISFRYNPNDTLMQISGFDAEGNDYTIYRSWPRGNSTIYSHTDDLKKDMIFNYDSNGKLTDQTKYNDDGECDWRDNQENGIWYHHTYEYGPDGWLKKETKLDAFGITPLKEWEYEPGTYLLLRETNSDKSFIEYDYSYDDPDDPEGYEWKQFGWHYDPNGGLVKTVEYDREGNIVDIIDPDGNPAQMVVNPTDGSYYFYAMEYGDRAEYHYSSKNEFFKEVRYDGSRISRIIERVSPNEKKDTHIWKDNTYSTYYSEINEDGDFIKTNRVEYFNSEGWSIKKYNYETKECSKFEYPPNEAYFIEKCYRGENFETFIEIVRHPYPQSKKSSAYDSSTMNFLAKKVFSPTGAGSAAAGAILLFPAIANAIGKVSGSAGVLPVSTVLLRFLSHPLSAGIFGAVFGVIAYLAIDWTAEKIQEASASSIGFPGEIKLTRSSFVKGAIGGVLLFLWWLSNPFRAFGSDKSDPFLKIFKLNSDEKEIKEFDVQKYSGAFIYSAMVFSEKGELIGKFPTFLINRILDKETHNIVGYSYIGKAGIFNKAGRKIGAITPDRDIQNIEGKIIGKVDDYHKGDLKNKRGKIVAIRRESGCVMLDINGTNYLLKHEDFYSERKEMVSKFFKNLSVDAQKKIISVLELSKGRELSLFIRDVVLTLREWHLREHNPMGIGELRQLIKADERSSAILVKFVLSNELFRDLFDVSFNELVSRAQKTNKSFAEFLRVDAGLKDNDVVKFSGILALFGGLEKAVKVYPKYLTGVVPKLFESVKQLKREAYFTERLYEKVLADKFLHKTDFENALINLYKSLDPKSVKRDLIEITSSLLGDNLSANTKKELNLKSIDTSAYKKVPLDSVVHNDTLVVKNYFYDKRWYDYLLKVLPAFGYPEGGIKIENNAFLATQRINGIMVKFIGILNSTEEEKGDPFSELKAGILVHRGHQGKETRTTFNGREAQVPLLLPLGCRSAGDADWLIAGKYPEAVMWGTGGTGEGLKNTPFVFHLVKAICKKEYTTWKQAYSYLEQRLGKGVARNYMRPDSLTFILIKELKKRYPDAVKNYNFQLSETTPARAGPRQYGDIFAPNITRREMLRGSFRLPIIGIILSGIRNRDKSTEDSPRKNDEKEKRNVENKTEPFGKRPLNINPTFIALLLFGLSVWLLGAERNLSNISWLAMGALCGCLILFLGKLYSEKVTAGIIVFLKNNGVSVPTIYKLWKVSKNTLPFVMAIMFVMTGWFMCKKMSPEYASMRIVSAVALSILSGCFLLEKQTEEAMLRRMDKIVVAGLNLMIRVFSLVIIEGYNSAVTIINSLNEKIMEFRNGVRKNDKSDFTITLGVSSEIYKKLISKDAISELYKRGINRVVSLDKFGAREEMMRELSEKTKGEKVICLLLDETTFGQLDLKDSQGNMKMKKFMNTVDLFVERAQKDIFPLMHPELTRINAETVKKINDAAKLRGFLDMHARTLREVESLELVDKSIYDERLADLQSVLFSKVKMSNKAKLFVENIAIGRCSKRETKYISVSAATAADMRFIAGALDKMGLDKQKASKFIQVRVCNKNVTGKNLDKYLKRTGLGAYLARENVKVVSSANELELEKTMDVVKQTFGNEINPGHVFIGDSRDIVQADRDSLKQKNAPVYVQMRREGTASQLLRAMIELAATGEKRKIKIKGLGIILRKDGYYVFLPDIKPVINLLREEIENYETICSMV